MKKPKKLSTRIFLLKAVSQCSNGVSPAHLQVFKDLLHYKSTLRIQ